MNAVSAELGAGFDLDLKVRVGDLGATRQQVVLSRRERLIVIAADVDLGGRLDRPGP